LPPIDENFKDLKCNCCGWDDDRYMHEPNCNLFKSDMEKPNENFKENLSKCCSATVTIDGDDTEGTHYYVCDKCGKSCDLKTENENFKDFVKLKGLNKTAINEGCQLCDICINDIEQFISDLLEEREKVVKEKYCSVPMGVTRWKEYGLEYGYWDYWLEKEAGPKNYERGFIAGADATGSQMNELKIEEIQKILVKRDEEWLNYLDKTYLEYCRKQNGRDDCKNCGLALDEIKNDLINKLIK